jgi:hypothetical protein
VREIPAMQNNSLGVDPGWAGLLIEKLWDPVLGVGNESRTSPVDLSHISSHEHSRQGNEPAEGLQIGVSRYENLIPRQF